MTQTRRRGHTGGVALTSATLSARTIWTLEHTEEIDARFRESRDRERREYEKPLSPDDRARDHAARWYSKHGVQTAVLAHLTASSWSLQWVGDCLRRDRTHPSDLGHIGEPWHDVEAERDGVRLFLEVIGHPGSLDGPWDEQAPRRPGYPTQGRAYAFPRYSDALFTGPGLRRRFPDARVVQAYPAQGLYRTYAPRAYGGAHMRRYDVELWLVNEDGSVEEQAEAEG